MSEESISELGRRLVIGRKRDGRSVYDPQAKRELILASRASGTSIAQLARECGVNANQLVTGVRQYERARVAEQEPPPVPSFVPVRVEAASTEAATRVSLDVQPRLPNGVLIDLRGCDVE